MSGKSISLNCVDKCLLALDGINESMIFHVILNLEGEIDAVRLNQAILSALKANPETRTILRSKHLRLFREIKEIPTENFLRVQDLAEPVDESYERCLSEWMNQPLDLWKEFPIRVLLLRKNETESSLVYTGHHVAFDGLGIVFFIKNIREYYNIEVSEDSKPSEDIYISNTGDELLGFARSQRAWVEHYYMKIIYNLFHRFIIAVYHPPTRVFHDRSGRSEGTGYCNGYIDREEFGSIRSQAKVAHITVNDVLIAACYRVIERWNRLHGKRSKNIRLMVPVFIGPKGPKKLVGNHISWVSVPTMPKDRADPVKLVYKLRADMDSIIKDGIPYSLIFLFFLCSRLPLFIMKGICRFLMITRIYVDTTFVSNVGVVRPEEWGEIPMGNAKVVSIDTVWPLVTPMGLSVGTYTYNGRLHVCLGYRTGLFSREKAQSFLNLYLEEIRNYPLGAEGS